MKNRGASIAINNATLVIMIVLNLVTTRDKLSSTITTNSDGHILTNEKITKTPLVIIKAIANK